VQTAVDVSNCAARTVAGNCRLCDTANRYFLDYSTLSCVQGTYNIPSITNTNVAEGMGGCLFGRKQGLLTTDSYECLQCSLGWQLLAVTTTAVPAKTINYCVPVNLNARKLQ
jgi:hypothetical protein